MVFHRKQPQYLAFFSSLILLISGCEQSSQLDRIQQRGELIVATRNTPSSWHHGAYGIEGLEFDLIQRFAKTQNLAVKFIISDDLQDLLETTQQGQVHMAAAGLVVTDERRKKLNFSQPYQTVSEKIVYRRGSKRPRHLSQLEPGQLHILTGSSASETLKRTHQEIANLEWISHRKLSINQLLKAVDQGDIPYTVAYTHDLASAQLNYRYIKTAITLKSDKQLAWAFPKQTDNSLRSAANQFLSTIKEDGSLAQLIERHYGHSNRLNFVDKRDFRRHLIKRFPMYRKYFQQAGKENNLDWRLLAAIAYQESHWRTKAVSPTGVRGIMMLTQATAKQVKVRNRNDPLQSIEGGAKYLKIIERKIPKRIKGFDRQWLTLAAYNVGFGHLEDARVLTDRQGGNPDLWMDVKERLPLLSKKKYYSTLKHGYARGREPLNYVENIRNYFDLLVWYEKNPQALSDDTSYSAKASASIDKKT